MTGETAKSIFERAQLPNETLGKIWALADTEQKGALGSTEFAIAMHLLASVRNGSMRAIPQILPAGLYEAAARRGGPPTAPRSRPTSNNVPAILPQQYTGGYQSPQGASFPQSVRTGEPWLITPEDKSQFDSIFTTVDTYNKGFVTGEQAVGFFSNSRLPEEALAQIWDLADINSEGQLNRDEFAVAMYLIRQQRSKTTGRDVLPQQLPANLIPPSFRRQPTAPAQPTAPTFDNAANITKPKSASDDLFGLDAISSPVQPLQPKTTGDSSNYATPPRNQASPVPTSGPQSHFKPFIPSSSFGQSITTQGTGTPSSASPATARSVAPFQQQSATDDLLGDPDPEVSKRLTTETTDLANLSNQVGTLTGQMQEIRSKHGVTGQELSHTQNQKRQFEVRLAELRSAYEQEVRQVRTLEDQLTTSKNDTEKLQSDMAMITGTHEDLVNQHRQIGEALAADQNENTTLKEKIRQASAGIEQLKPQLEKLRSDARHQKGLVAINKKQLATHEAEREKLRGEVSETTEEHAQASRELEESQRGLEGISQSKSIAPQPAVTSPGPIASPAPSTASLNPFFRQPTNPPVTERGPPVASPFTPPNVSSPNHNAFDSFFGPSPPSSNPPPPTSFRSDSPSLTNTKDITRGSQLSTDGVGSVTPPTSPPQSVSTDSPATVSEPPAPPQSRQITSSFLPLRPPLDHSDSESSSVRVIPPASRMGEPADFSSRAPSEAPIKESPLQHFENVANRNNQDTPQQLTPSSTGNLSSLAGGAEKSQGHIARAQDVPGAFPGAFPGDDETPQERSPQDLFANKSPYSTGGVDPRVDSGPPTTTQQLPSLAPGVSDPFGKSSTPTSAKDDFESAFEGFSGAGGEGKSMGKGKGIERANGSVADDPFAPSTSTTSKAIPAAAVAVAAAPAAAGEFPPIKELEADDSDSDSDKGFEDDFGAGKTKESGANTAFAGQVATTAVAKDTLAPAPPSFSAANSIKSDLPTPGAEISPPTYDTAAKGLDCTTSNSFPPEFSGLLPSRDDMASPPSLSKSVSHPNEAIASPPTETANLADVRSPSNEGSIAPMAPGASLNATYAYISSSTPFDGNDSPVSSAPREQQQQQQQQGSSIIPPPSEYTKSTTSAGPPPFTESSQQPIQSQQEQPPILPAKILPTPQPPPHDDFDDFNDLADAQEDDGKDDTLDFGRSRGDHADALSFNPTFDEHSSPGQSHRQLPSQASTNAAFDSFAATPAPVPAPVARGLGVSDATATAKAGTGTGTAGGPVDHDWDAIFAGLDGPAAPAPPPTTSTANGTSATTSNLGGTTDAAATNSSAGAGKAGARPVGVLARQKTQDESTDGDDPILARLMGMGFKRTESLRALEKYDYNIDKVGA